MNKRRLKAGIRHSGDMRQTDFFDDPGLRATGRSDASLAMQTAWGEK